MSSIIIHAALGPSNFERGSERWETKQLGSQSSENYENYQLPPGPVSWLDNILIPVCPLHSIAQPVSSVRVVCLAKESRYQTNYGDTQVSWDKADGETIIRNIMIIVSWVPVYYFIRSVYSLSVVCVLWIFAQLNWIKGFTPQDVAELQIRRKTTRDRYLINPWTLRSLIGFDPSFLARTRWKK